MTTDSPSPCRLQPGLRSKNTNTHAGLLDVNCVLLTVLSRFVVPAPAVCLERGVTYTLRFEFKRYQDANSILHGAAEALLLMDSVRGVYFSTSLKC